MTEVISRDAIFAVNRKEFLTISVQKVGVPAQRAVTVEHDRLVDVTF